MPNPTCIRVRICLEVAVEGELNRSLGSKVDGSNSDSVEPNIVVPRVKFINNACCKFSQQRYSVGHTATLIALNGG